MASCSAGGMTWSSVPMTAQDGIVCHAGAVDRPERHRPSRGIPAAAEHQDPAVRGQACGLGQQRGLAGPRLAAQDQRAALLLPYIRHKPVQRLALVVSASQRKRGRLTGVRERRWGSGRVLVHDILRFLVAA
jgi:hypothetical protein